MNTNDPPAAKSAVAPAATPGPDTQPSVNNAPAEPTPPAPVSAAVASTEVKPPPALPPPPVNPPHPATSASTIAALAEAAEKKEKKVKDPSKVKKVKAKDENKLDKSKKKRKVDDKDKTKGKKKKEKTPTGSNPTKRLPTAQSRDKKKDAASSSMSMHPPGYSAQQAAVRDMMRRALEEDQYSALGSIVETDSSSDDESVQSTVLLRRNNKFNKAKLDRNFLLANVKKHMRVEGLKNVENFDEAVFLEDADDFCEGGGKSENFAASNFDDEGEELASDGKRIGKRKKKKRKGIKRGSEDVGDEGSSFGDNGENHESGIEEEFEEMESSIFGETVGSSNATWVECDRCKKWRRLRGVVDARKLPSKWFCSMNRNDPERSKCSAPEEEYDGAMTPESDVDVRTQKHLRVWVRRLHCNEVFENKQSRHAAKKMALLKEPYEWIRCCNPSCGKWRMLLKSMDSQNVLDQCKNREFYCVMNTWDEKVASCGAAQENLPTFGCPPWVNVDED